MAALRQFGVLPAKQRTCDPFVSTRGGPNNSLTFALQALLSRHESHIQSSRLEHEALQSQVLTLESEKTRLQSVNERLIDENRDLLDQLETLNGRLGDSEVAVKNLETTLSTMQHETRRLNAMAVRAEALEKQLVDMEIDRLRLSDKLAVGIENEKSALDRWREAEDRVRELCVEVERIELEAQQDKQRHEELMSRIQRERQLGSSEGRLKCATAVIQSQIAEQGCGKNAVVSHFVRDILQDNANLQTGVVELRGLLQASNEEVQGLREQILMHQPAQGKPEDEGGMVQSSTLLEEVEWLQPKQDPNINQEVHVHHHYHARLSAGRRERVSIGPRRPGRKHSSSRMLASTPESSVPSTPNPGPQRHVSSPLPCIVKRVQLSPRKPRWSMQSSTTASSNPSSPRSYFDQMSSGSIFDRIEHVTESSRPTSPESAIDGYASPTIPLQTRMPPNCSLPTFDERVEDDEEGPPIHAASTADTKSLRGAEPAKPGTAVSHDLKPAAAMLESAIPTKPPDTSLPERYMEHFRPEEATHSREVHTLRRSSSNDSLVSISGMDIHLAKRKPSRVFVINRHTALAAPRPDRTISASVPVATVADVTASSSKRSLSSDSKSLSQAMLSGLVGTAGSGSISSQTATVLPPAQTTVLGSLVGGWVRGRWGIAPMKSVDLLRAQAASNAVSRAPGINTKGSIPGLGPPVRTPSEVHARILNKGLLKESLEE